jgi:hypothetical protein
MKLIMEGWRDFLDKSGKKPKPEEKKEKEESSRDEKRRESVAKALARGGLTQKQAEEWLESGQSTVELEEAEELEEGWKDIALAGALGLSALAGPSAQAADVDVPPDDATQTAESLSTEDMENIDDFFIRIVNAAFRGQDDVTYTQQVEDFIRTNAQQMIQNPSGEFDISLASNQAAPAMNQLETMPSAQAGLEKNDLIQHFHKMSGLY